MVEVKQPELFEEFNGIVQSVQLETTKGDNGEEQRQVHLEMNPTNKEIKGKTGLMHEWVKLSPTCTDTSVPEGSVIHRYIQELEFLEPELKKKEKVIEVFEWLKDKHFLFKKKVLGRSYKGHEARESWVPVKRLMDEPSETQTE